MNNELKLHALKAVYTYFFPEVREISKLPSKIDSSLFLTTTSVEEAKKGIDKLGFDKSLTLPQTSEGKIDLDLLHEPVIKRISKIYSEVLRGISEFKHSYFTSGSSEGIFHVLSELKARGVNEIYTLSGEYEGYKEYGNAIGIKTTEINLDKTKLNSLDKKVWFISNPSARDGNTISNEVINEICDNASEVFLDFAYAGLTKENMFDISHKNIKGFFLSFSKPYGFFRFRAGFAFSKEELKSLYGNKWFKDIGRVLTSLKLAEDIGPNFFHKKYGKLQSEIVNSINKKYSLKLKKSDSLLIAYMSSLDFMTLSPEGKNLVSPYKRGESYRFCLTPYFEKIEKGEPLFLE
ncbi:MAG: aminotransferase class I/II-fold pyridoxal phosphate-dependent enzyme [Nanoarchaeota archaeon]|nr:aminotransferase class I/II-fold pyridoxal phosphate-dependent enzyme [Nanoarchaeota archaeon]